MTKYDSSPEFQKISRIYLIAWALTNWRCIEKKVFVVEALIDWLKRKVLDPRSPRKKTHDCGEILAYVIMAYACGRTSLRRAVRWAQENIDFLRQYMKLKNGIASVSTIHRLLRDIDQEEFNNIFMQWVARMIKDRQLILAIDGKALRGATDRIAGGRTPYILNVIDVKTKLVIAQLPIDDKANEISAIPRLLGILDLKRNLITIDAIGTQWRIMDIIMEKGGFYLLTVKENQPVLFEDIKGYFRIVRSSIDHGSTTAERERYSCCESIEKNRSRIEHRKLEAIQQNPIISREELAFDDIKTIGLRQQVRIPKKRDKDGNDITPDYQTFKTEAIARENDKKKKKEQSQYADEVLYEGLISNKEMTAEEMAEIKRQHWIVENGLHYVLDDLFREDRSNATVTKDNMALIRKFAFNLLQIGIHYDYPEYGPTEMMDKFSDNHDLLAKYIFSGIESF